MQVSGSYGDQEETVLYGVFNTPTNSIGGSAVCAFRLADISSAFEGQFKEQRNTGDNWLPVEPHRVPQPRPGIYHPGCHKVLQRGNAVARHNIFCEAQNGRCEGQKGIFSRQER